MKLKKPKPSPEYKENVSTVPQGALTISHIESGGVGYSDGYTSLSAFTLLNRKDNNFIYPFIDLRFHEFNDNTQAANGGLGLRFPFSHKKKIFGVNLYYDYRNSEHNFDYNQIGAGLEIFDTDWKLTVNGYQPFGNTSHLLWSKTTDYDGGYYIRQDCREISFKGFDFELSKFNKRSRKFDWWAGLGSYYYRYTDKNLWGGKARLGLIIRERFIAESFFSYDDQFKFKPQILIGFKIPFGGKIKKGDANSKESPKLLASLLTRPIQRNEIIPLDDSFWWEWNY